MTDLNLRAMQLVHSFAVYGIALGSATLLITGDAVACSICLAGDPIFDSQGATAQQKGDFSAYVEVRGWKKRGGHLPHGEEEDEEHEEEEHEAEEFEENDSKQVNFVLSGSPLDRVTLSMNVPLALNEITEVEGDEKSKSELTGVGDVSFNTSVVLWRNRDVLPSTWLESRLFLKTPTGKSKQRRNGIRDKHLQAGTGSWDVGAGVAGIHRFSWGTAYSSVSYRVNTEGSLDYEYGDVVLVNAALTVPLGHVTGVSWLAPFTPGLELNYRYAEKDTSHGESFDDSGGSILYITPSLRVHIPLFEGRRRPSIRASVQLPVTNSWLNGFQDEDPVWSVGLLFPF